MLPSSIVPSGLPLTNCATTGFLDCLNSSGLASSIIFPWYNIAMRVAMRKALSISCVAVMDVTFDFSVRLIINSSITEAMTGSRPADGSSNRINSGSSTRGRARATRFRILRLDPERNTVEHFLFLELHMYIAQFDNVDRGAHVG